MCGIAGLIDASGRMSSSHTVNLMADTMIRRGPDGYGEFVEGNVAMSMRRLSIIDLERGGQPLTSRDGNVVAFQNGEIYNFKPLRDELVGKGCQFKTDSDTEVLAHGYAVWGIEGLLARVDGMYAIAIYDRRGRTLHLARDRFGEKPLFYTVRDGLFAYSSNTLALKMLDDGSMGISPRGLNYYMALHFIPGDLTIFENIFRALPGERLEIKIDTLEIKKAKYYEIPIGRVNITPDELSERLEESVRSRLVADVPVGVFLSGGLDSSIIASMATRFKNKIDTFSMGFLSGAHDESSYARELSGHIDSTHHHFYFDENVFAGLLPKVAASLDEPVGDQAMLPLYWLAEEAGKHVKVVLSGEGADEVFGGYDYYGRFQGGLTLTNRIRSLIKNRAWKGPPASPSSHQGGDDDALDTLIENSAPITPSGFPLLLDAAERRPLLGATGVNKPYEEGLFKTLSRAQDPLQRASLTDLLTWLPDDLLVKLDRMAMAHSIEGRAPYLSPSIVSAGINLAPELKITGNERKKFLKAAAAKWVPDSIINRKKQGFVLPMRKWTGQWFESHGGARAYIKDNPMPHLNADILARAISMDIARGLRRERVWLAMILLLEWHSEYNAKVKALRNLVK